MEIILDQTGKFIMGLQWSYVITFILLAWVFSRNNALESWWKEDKLPALRSFLLAFPKGLRIAALGATYAVAHYFIYDLTPTSIASLLESFVAAVAFHGIILKGIQKKFGL